MSRRPKQSKKEKKLLKQKLSKLVGTWKLFKSPYGNTAIQFKKDGKFVHYHSDRDGFMEYTGEYQIEDDEVICDSEYLTKENRVEGNYKGDSTKVFTFKYDDFGTKYR